MRETVEHNLLEVRGVKYKEKAVKGRKSNTKPHSPL
jgi:hypothetical protein